MHLPSKIQSRNIALAILIIILLFFPFRKFTENIFIFFSRQLIFSPQSIRQETALLKKRNLALTLALRELIYLRSENEKLKTALHFKAESNAELVGVEIIAFDPSSFRRFAIVNAGYERGVKKGAYAINDSGYLVGKVSEVKRNYSYLILLDDPDFSLPVFIGDSALGILKGTLDGVDIFYIEEQDKVKAKDKVWVKLANVSFPIYIGEVRKIRKDRNNLFLGVEVTMFSKELLLNKIFIIKR